MEYRNLAELHRRQALRFGPRPALRFKRQGLYQDYSWEQYRADALAGAAALVEKGLAPGDRVGLLSENRYEWLLADLAILSAGGVTVSPHAPLTAKQVQFQLEHSGARWLFVSNANQLAKVQQVRDSLPELFRAGSVSDGPSVRAGSVSDGSSDGSPRLIVFDRQGTGPGEEVVSWEAFLCQGRRTLARDQQVRWELLRREEQLGPDDLATIMYTSGTTGNPKGVMLTHGNLLSNAIACVKLASFQASDILLTWLPFTHIYARTVDHYGTLVSGVRLALAESPETLLDNLAEIQPTHMSSVPRFYEKVLAAVSAEDPAETGSRLRRIFGPRVDWLSSGGAPLPVSIAQAYHDAGLLVLEGYGLTESSPVISFNTKEHHKRGTVGQAISGVEVKIAADGEVLTRGPHVMKGYWKNPEATAQAIRDGWLHTGDLGNLDEEGYLSITGRKKELLVLSNGKNVLPSEVEGLLLADPCIDQAMICGEGKNYLTALLVPHWDNLRQALAAEGMACDPVDEQAGEAVHTFLERRVRAALADVSSAQQVKKFAILPCPFSVENEELTVSLKMRRNVILAHHAEEVEALYRG
jgi:long-chain acyl-CoA synthetase